MAEMILTNILKEVEPKLSNWWENNDQEQPLVLTTCLKENADIPDTDNLEVFWKDIDFIMKRRMAIIDNTRYHGVAVPFQLIDFASSAMACALGGRPELLNKETIWCYPAFNSLEDVAEVKLTEANPVYHHILQLGKRSTAAAPNHHMIAHFPLEGPLDIIADLYGSEKLLTDLLLNPDGVKNAALAATRAWMKGFNDVNNIISKSGNKGGIGWAGIWAPGTTFPIQEDFSYMISKEMFDEFSLPHIIEMVEAMDYGFYHLDGKGSIIHLDSLLQIEKLRAIQWQPGAGNEKLSQWYDLIRKILNSGKSVQLFGKPEEIDDLIKNVGTRGVMVICGNLSRDEAERLEEKYG